MVFQGKYICFNRGGVVVECSVVTSSLSDSRRGIGSGEVAKCRCEVFHLLGVCM